MRKPLICTLLAITLAATGAAASGAAQRFVGISGYTIGPVANATGLNYTVRASYVAPGSWKLAKAKRDAITRRFGPVGSCKFKITVTARAVADADEPATARVTRLLPASGRYVRDEGTHRSAAWRIISAKGADTTTGMLVKTATGVRTQPPGKRVWLELIAVGTPDPKTECHAGGPRSVAAGFATILATGSLGGFQPQ